MELGAWLLALGAWSSQLGLEACLELGAWNLELGAWSWELEAAAAAAAANAAAAETANSTPAFMLLLLPPQRLLPLMLVLQMPLPLPLPLPTLQPLVPLPPLPLLPPPLDSHSAGRRGATSAELKKKQKNNRMAREKNLGARKKTVPENRPIFRAAIRNYELRVKKWRRKTAPLFVRGSRFLVPRGSRFLVPKKTAKAKRIFQLAFSCFSCGVSGSPGLMLPGKAAAASPPGQERRRAAWTAPGNALATGIVLLLV